MSEHCASVVHGAEFGSGSLGRAFPNGAVHRPAHPVVVASAWHEAGGPPLTALALEELPTPCEIRVMKIGVQTWGSEGDCRPLLALAHGLKVAGHDVTLVVTNVEGQRWAERGGDLGVRTEDVAVDWYVENREKTLLAMREILQSHDDIRQIRLTLERFLLPVQDPMLHVSKRLCETHDAVVGHFLADTLTVAAAKAHRPYVSVVTATAIPSRHITPGGLPAWGERMNLVWWAVARASMNLQIRPVLQALRKREALPPVDDALAWLGGSGALNLISNSPTLVPRPADWGPRHVLCGFFDLPAKDASPLPVDVARFLDEGEPPVFLTFGSMLTADPNDEHLTETLELVVQGALAAGVRAIVQAPWERAGNVTSSPTLLRVGRCMHNQIFPRCAAIVHHGGAGTTQAACLAGKPSVVVPFLNDQPMWAQRLFDAGVAPRAFPRPKLTPRRLAEAIAATRSPSMIDRSRAVGEQMRREDGVKTAVGAIEGFLA